ncbi:hypothetical protein KA005_18210, partial [bacterium]|nr:hypothetical protein [bacterium]
TYRCLALNGAEIGFMSSVAWGWKERKDLVTRPGVLLSSMEERRNLVMCANALLNGMYVVVATTGYDESSDGSSERPNNPKSDLYQVSKIINTDGSIVADSKGIPGIVYADVDVSVKYRTHGRVGTYESGELRQIIMTRRRPDTYGILTGPKKYPGHTKTPDHSIKAAAIQWGKTPATRSLTTLNERINVMKGYLDNAGSAGCDVIVMPEGWCRWDAYKLRAGKSIYDLCSSKASQYSMYVVWWQVEDAGGKKYNTAFLMDRSGKLMGRYRKVHLDWKDELEGITAGSTYPKFDASSDFETLGLLIGFDNLFFEAPRCLFRDKVHVLLTPVSNIDALGKDKFEMIMRRTAFQEGMWTVASLNSEIETDACAGIFSTWGGVSARAATDGIVTHTFNTNEVLWWNDESRYYRESYMDNSRPEAYGHLCDPVVVPIPSN